MSALSRCIRLAGRPLEKRDALRPVDAIVILGAPPLVDGSISRVLAERVEMGVELYRREVAPWVIVTGGMPRGGRTEAQVMAEYALALGLPAHALIEEGDSRTTRENAEYTAALMRERGLSRAWLVIQPFHLRRSVRVFERFGLTVYACAHDDSLQYRDLRIGAKWVSREYAAWLVEFARSIAPTSRSR